MAKESGQGSYGNLSRYLGISSRPTSGTRGSTSTGGRGTSVPSSFGKAKKYAVKNPFSSATGKVDRAATKSYQSKSYVTAPRKTAKGRSASPKRSIWEGGSGRSQAISKPSAIGKKNSAKYGGKKLPKGM